MTKQMKSWEVATEAWDAFNAEEFMSNGIQAVYEAGKRAALTGALTARDAEVRAAVLAEAEAAVTEMERAFVTSEWGTVVRKLDARNTIRALAKGEQK